MKFLKSIVLSVFMFMLIANVSHAQAPKDFEKARSKWLHRTSKDAKKLPRLYLKQALMLHDDEVIRGQEAIRLYVADHQNAFVPFTSSESQLLFIHSDRKVLDVGFLNVEDERKKIVDQSSYVFAWRKVDDTWYHELDIIFSDKGQTVADECAAERSTWIKYANGNDRAVMVNSLFLDDAIYLNNAEASIGQAAIADRFDFIKNPNFQINLKNEKFIKIDDSTAVDIGNWLTGDFVGYYLILWKKDAAGAWKIFLYFNF